MIKFIYFILLTLCVFNNNLCFSTIATVNKPNITRKALPEKASLVIDCSNLKRRPIVLYQQSANEIRHPASLTKIMTIYLLLEAIQKKQVTFNTKFTVSKFAAKQMPAKLNLKVGEKISVLDCIKALLVKSANDVAVVVAEGLCGSVPEFCKVMNKKAKSLGMRNTHYENPSGVPNKKQVTCANDIAILGLSLMKKFPQYWHLFSLKKFNYKEKEYNTHCKILRWYNAADGAKTGYICASGFNLWVTATKYNKEGKSKRLCAIIFGERSGRERDFKAARLLDNYFQDYTIINKNKNNDVISKINKTLDKKINNINNKKEITNNKSTNKKESIISNNKKKDISKTNKFDSIKSKNEQNINISKTNKSENINVNKNNTKKNQNINIKESNKTNNINSAKLISNNKQINNMKDNNKTNKIINTTLQNNKNSIIDNNVLNKQISNIKDANKYNNKQNKQSSSIKETKKTDNTNLQDNKKRNKLIDNIDKYIDNVLKNNNEVQNNTHEEEVLYEIESFPMDDIIKSSGKSKEYFDELYKDDIPLQIESSTPIDFSSNKKTNTTKSSKKSNKKSNNNKQTIINKNIKNSKDNKNQKSNINNKQKAINNNMQENKNTKNQKSKLLTNNKNNNNKNSIKNSNITNNNKLYTNSNKTKSNGKKLPTNNNKSKNNKNKLSANKNNIKNKNNRIYVNNNSVKNNIYKQ